MAQQEEFREFMERTGCTDALWKVLIDTDKFKGDIADPIEYLRRNLDPELTEQLRLLKQQVADAGDEIIRLFEEYPKITDQYVKKKRKKARKRLKKGELLAIEKVLKALEPPPEETPNVEEVTIPKDMELIVKDVRETVLEISEMIPSTNETQSVAAETEPQSIQVKEENARQEPPKTNASSEKRVNVVDTKEEADKQSKPTPKSEPVKDVSPKAMPAQTPDEPDLAGEPQDRGKMLEDPPKSKISAENEDAASLHEDEIKRVNKRKFFCC